MLTRDQVQPEKFYPLPAYMALKVGDETIHWIVMRKAGNDDPHRHGCENDVDLTCPCADEPIAFVASALHAEGICLALNRQEAA